MEGPEAVLAPRLHATVDIIVFEVSPGSVTRSTPREWGQSDSGSQQAAPAGGSSHSLSGVPTSDSSVENEMWNS